jgi:hypothetical protein
MLVAMLRKKGRRTVTFGIADPPPEMLAKYEAMAKDLMADMEEMAFNPDAFDATEHTHYSGWSPPFHWPGIVTVKGDGSHLFVMEGRLYRVLDFDVANKVLFAERFDDRARVRIPKVEYMAKANRNATVVWERLAQHRQKLREAREFTDLQGTFTVECRGPDGELKWQEIRPNKIVTDGFNATIHFDPTKQPPPRIIYPEAEPPKPAPARTLAEMLREELAKEGIRPEEIEP